ncbi:MAG: RdgB/HAM1 family non-canonical purine NTP pyrophosphatase [Herpetosiphonaceae bacterium]|nr:RdgB/HAM1 family non-canonical purine NTP pyrophosphatase [Herpetosiphonaceae bacterium]
MDLLIATTNQHKLAEFRGLFRALPYQVMSLSDVGITDEVAETGLTFRENAIAKAEGYAALSGLLTLADDSGLAVDALGGRPGVFSARYGGPNADPPTQHRLLLQELQGVLWEQRTAQFVCGIAMAQRGRTTAYVERQWPGLVAWAPQGSHGFGYDPLFWLPDEGCTAGELPPDQKNRISHRAMAAQAAHALLLDWPG